MQDSAGRTYEAHDVIKVMALLPHRYPFLMVDRIIDARGDEYGVGLKNVTLILRYRYGFGCAMDAPWMHHEKAPHGAGLF